MKVYKAVILIGILVSSFFVISTTPVYAYRCSGNCDGCGPKPSGGQTRCGDGDDGAEYGCCWDDNCSDSKKGCGGTGSNDPGCGNCDWFCDKPPECQCTPVSCPPSNPQNKFMTRSTSNGNGRSCGDPCNPSNYACPATYHNAVPSCAILPASISMTREDAPRQITLTATDQDYGDTVQVTKVRVVDTAGNLKSCVKVSTLGGGSVENLTVKAGSDNSSNTSQSTDLMVDARESHGIFDNVNGQSICSGFLEVEIRDIDSDGNGPDVSDYGTCKVAVSVTNQAPQLTDVSIYDNDIMDTVREAGDLVDGRNILYVGSPLTTQSKARASVCNEPLSLLDPIKCPGGGERYEAAFSQRRNPLRLEFTVRDANGRNDIMQAGVWLQREAQDANNATVPPVNLGAGVRNSFQAMYSEKENMQVVSGIARSNMVSRACTGSNCGPTELLGSTKQIFSALAFINSLGQTVGNNGNVLIGKLQSASQRAWQSVGFPDCLNTTIGCVNANVPDTAKTASTADAAARANYEWAIAADDSHLLCYQSNSNTPTVVAASTPAVCPVGCAACIKKEGVTAVNGDANALTFKFGIYFNDKDGGQGMPEGEYAVFISALDKVAVPLNNVTGKGAEGWLKFNKSGAACNGATCPSGTDFNLMFDSSAPTVSNVTWNSTSGTAVANLSIADKAGGSGIAGVTNKYMVRQEMLEGEPLGDRQWALDSAGNPLNGMNSRTALPASTTYITITGYGLDGGEEVVTGACVYDRAGNMGCGRNGTEYVFLAPWLKTSYGDIFSAKGGSVPFSQTLPTNDGTTADNSKSVYSPFTEQIFTAGTGLFMTGGAPAQGIGISGGYLLNPTTNAALGFKNYYRTGTSSYNVFGHTPFLPGNEYERLRASARLNCDLMNTTTPNTCNTDGGLDEVGAATYNVLTVGTQTVADITCSRTNVIFVTGTLTINGQVKKSTTGQNNGCMFVIAAGGSIIIGDTPSDVRLPAPEDTKRQPTADIFDAAIVANSGASVTVNKGARGATSKSTDRLEIRGWVYSSSTVPLFKRDLAPVDNRRYPAEWIKYDANLLDIFRPLLGVEKTVDLTCGTTTHPFCTTTN